MHWGRRPLTDEERCLFEIESIRAQDGQHPAWLTALGEADWHAELELLNREARNLPK